MIWPWSYRRLYFSALGELSDLQSRLTAESQLRVSAEALSADRLSQVQRAEERAALAEQHMIAAMTEQRKSLDLVNTTLLKQLAPEPAERVDIKAYTEGALKTAEENIQARKKKQAWDRTGQDLYNLMEMRKSRPVVSDPPAESATG